MATGYVTNGTTPLGALGLSNSPWLPEFPNLTQAQSRDGMIIGAGDSGEVLGNVDDPIAALFNDPGLGLYVWAIESLFSDAYVSENESPNGETRGFWAQDIMLRGPLDSAVIPEGNKAWVYLFRGFNSDDVGVLKSMTESALAWMTQSGLVDVITVTCSYANGKASVSVSFTKDGTTLTFKHPNVLAAWEGWQ